ncbi:hypothetical protein [Salinigranum rubrum]|nr:hypothetical protein [Salinigranum rubrum]
MRDANGARRTSSPVGTMRAFKYDAGSIPPRDVVTDARRAAGVRADAA